jgi:hemerythrin-like domain-containing protein
LQGAPKDWAEQLAELALSLGFSGFILTADLADGTALYRFAEEVAPAVRELVARERTGPPLPVAAGAIDLGVVFPETPNLRVAPTPDPGRRLSDVRVWDESARPRGPRPDASMSYSDRGRGTAQQLIDVHDHLRQELAQLRDLVRQVAAGELGVSAARSAINAMTIRQNRWTLGTYCESYCRVVTTHHTIEDVALFPRLRAADSRLAAVVDRLAEEHGTIHEVLDGVDAALVAMVGSADGGIAQVQRAVDLLTDTLLSHLSYEEGELVEPLARLNIPL